jgi:hypothetical protein
MFLFIALIILLTSFSRVVAAEKVPFEPRSPLQGILTDGSPMEWKDTVRSGVSHYEFLFDAGPDKNGVPVGEIILDQSQYPTLEAEWIIYFPEGMPPPEEIKSSTEVCLTGMAEAKYMQVVLTKQYDAGKMPWGPMSKKNDVIAKGYCIRTTIGEVANGSVKAQVVVEETTKSGTIFRRINRAKSLHNEKLVEYLQEISQYSREECKRVDFVNLGATDKKSALVNENPRRIRSLLKSPPFYKKEKVLQTMFSDAIRDGHFTQSGKLTVTLGSDKIGEAHITVTPSAPKTNECAASC